MTYWKTLTLEQQAYKKTNILDLVRLLTAVLVLCYHAIFILPFGATIEKDIVYANSNHIDAISSISVIIFFIISGYLICSSWLSRPDFGVFIQKRIGRIFPALITCVAITALAVGPLLTEDIRGFYFTAPAFYTYWNNIFLVLSPLQHLLPGLFTHNLIAEVNGSLWSLHLECFAYIGLLFFGLISWLNHRWFFLAVFVFSILAFIQYATLDKIGIPERLQQQIPFLHFNTIQLILKFSCIFGSGVALRLFQDRIPYRFELALLGAVGFGIGIFSHNPTLYFLSLVIALPYLVVYIGLLSNPTINIFFKKFGDISYGVYIYHQLILQILLAVSLRYFGKQLHGPMLLLLGLPISLFVGYL